MFVCRYVFTYLHVYTHIHIRVCIHICSHTHTDNIIICIFSVYAHTQTDGSLDCRILCWTVPAYKDCNYRPSSVASRLSPTGRLVRTREAGRKRISAASFNKRLARPLGICKAGGLPPATKPSPECCSACTASLGPCILNFEVLSLHLLHLTWDRWSLGPVTRGSGVPKEVEALSGSSTCVHEHISLHEQHGTFRGRAHTGQPQTVVVT